MTSLKIRPGKPLDQPQLVDLWQRSVRATHDFLNDAQIAALRPLVADSLPTLDIWIAEDQRQSICGFIGLQANKVEMLFIDAERRGQGAGTALLRHAERQHPELWLDVNEQNPQALGFYRQFGFQVTGRSERDGQGNPFPLLHMRLNRQ